METTENIISNLKKVWNAFNNMEHELYADYVFDALELLKEQQERIAIMSEGGWHDAEKDQPKETDCYIVRIDYGVGQMTTMREYISSEGKWLKGIEEKITHWMPLPEPPKEGEQE